MLNKQTSTDTIGLTIDDNTHSDMTLTAIIETYKALSIKLSLFADVLPETPDEQRDMIRDETLLLDQQASLLETALSRPVMTLDDAKAVLTLWHHEVVQSQLANNLNAADELVNSVFKFFQAD